MTTFDYILLIVAVVALAYQLYLLFRAKREIIIKGTAPSRGAVVVLLAVVLVLALVRTENLRHTWPVFVVIGITCLSVFAGGCGIGRKGMFSSGRFIAFGQAEYYEVKDFKNQKIFVLSRTTRATQMVISEADLAQVLEIMEEQGIPEYAVYTKRLAKRTANRMEASANKSKKKKKK